MQRERLWLFAYLAGIVALGYVHDLRVVGAVVLVLVALGGRRRWLLLRRAVAALLLFNATVTLTYLLAHYFFGLPEAALLLINLRALAMTLMTFTLVSRVNMARALSFSKTLSLLYTLCVSQVIAFMRSYAAFSEGLRSRHAGRQRGTRLHALLAQLYFFMYKTLSLSQENAMGMRSRGVMDD
ncbi:hypothetical protein LOH54_07025 [Sulfurimonas sp. HSL-3221]|uniref:hypothetical protein n=1 Tax=Sulfurimonadaceae TaxID=2771471 RepID=UPI001E58A927|nr:hypothetical protein [Sulfurimonas sp. HSL-3221]UFS61412.1 hypothetical protein LOH54_07025 [Sulfurimonas sp. HSL-3221]